jgi:ATP-dependent Clp protease ATP-binding subunit ClpA
MDHGTLTDSNGRKADFRHAVLIMTTNAGAEDVQRRSMGFTEQDHSTDGLEILKKKFSPEFRNRLDAVVQFRALPPIAVEKIVDKFLIELQNKLKDKQVHLEVDNIAKDWFANYGYDKHMGARPMARLMKEKLKKPLAEELLFGELSEAGGRVSVTVENHELKIMIEATSVTP